MVEVVYDIVTKKVRGWCGDEEEFGNFNLATNEEVVILPIDIPNLETDIYFVDLKSKELMGNPEYIAPKPLRDLFVEVDQIKLDIQAIQAKTGIGG